MSIFNLNKSGTCHYTMDVSIPAEDVNNSFRTARNAIRGQVSLKGFRKGKAPDALLNKKYEPQIKEEANRNLLETFVRKGLEENEVEPLTMPSFVEGKEGTVEHGQPFEFSMEFDVRPEFDLPNFKGIALEKTAVEVGDDKVDEFLNQRLESRATYGAVERAAQSGDMLKASLKCDIDPDAEDVPAAAKRMIACDESWLLLSEPEMIPGIAEGLVGVTAGEEKEMTVEFPEDYYEPFLASKTVNYVFGIQEVQGKTTPELTDEMAKEMGGESIVDIREQISKHLQGDADNAARGQLQEQATEKLLALVDFDLPPQAFQNEVEAAISEQKQSAAKAEGDEEVDEDALREQAETDVTNRLRMRFLVDAIAKAEEITVEPNEITGELRMFQSYSGLSDKDFAERFDRNALVERIYMSNLHNKVLGKVIDEAEVNEKTAE
jgi:trigger factor